MKTEPLIAMLGILVALGVMFAIYFVAYRYYKTRRPHHPQDR
jgi:hypothetical protein